MTLPLRSVLAVGPLGHPNWSTVVALKAAAGVAGDEAAAGQALALWAGQLLLKEVPRSREGVQEREEAVVRFVEAVRTEGERSCNLWALVATATIPNPAAPPPALVLTAGRYVALSGLKPAWDLAGAGQWVDEVPPDWLESRVFNLRALYRALEGKARDHAAKTGKAKCPTTPQPPSFSPTPTPPPSASSPSP